ncbi:MAG: PLP-dependent transferase, partial [Flavobacteriales bacterium]|nr:PLP-dependent transferase [Flavobacteriales bacterium]
AKELEQHRLVESVNYPFLPSHPQYQIAKAQMKAGGGLVAFKLKGGAEEGRCFLNALKMSSLTANLGDSRTIVSHPASTTHAKLSEEDRLEVGITANLIRISVGLEHIDDIKSDILDALETL